MLSHLKKQPSYQRQQLETMKVSGLSKEAVQKINEVIEQLKKEEKFIVSNRNAHALQSLRMQLRDKKAKLAEMVAHQANTKKNRPKHWLSICHKRKQAINKKQEQIKELRRLITEHHKEDFLVAHFK